MLNNSIYNEINEEKFSIHNDPAIKKIVTLHLFMLLCADMYCAQVK